MNVVMIVELVSAAAVIAGVVFAAVQIRHYRMAREDGVALEMLHSLQTPDFIKALRIVYDLPEGLSRSEIDELLGDDVNLIYALMTTWESLGILVCRRQISLSLVDDFFSGSIVISWKKLQRYVTDERAERERLTLLEWFQWLAERMEERESQLHPVPAYEAERAWKPK